MASRKRTRSVAPPPWVDRVGMALWVTGPDGKITFFNARAEALLGRRAEECIGRPCYEVIGGLTADGRAHCGADCPVLRRARGGAEVEPFDLCVPSGSGKTRRVRVIAIAAISAGARAPSIAHCAENVARPRRAERFLRALAERTPQAAPAAERAARAPLTPREREVLERLAADETLYSIAMALHVSHATVRNHVQHILAKTGSHSILEAVARYLLEMSAP
jgi:DNA-binding CsgD family transcriptional regulator